MEDAVYKEHFRSGQKLPKAVAEAPRLYIGLDMYLTAFFELTTDRQNGMSVGFIPWTSRLNYARLLKLNDMDTQEFIYIIGRMDSAYIKDINAEKDTK